MVILAWLGIALAGLIDGPHQITQNGYGAFEASLARSGDGFTVAWYDTRDGHPEIYSRRIDGRGRPAGPERRLTTSVERAYEADIASVGKDLALAWYEVGPNRTSHARLGLWTADGRRLWSMALALPERISKNPVVRTRGQEIFCAWLAENAARDFEVYAAWFDRDGNPIAPAQRLGPAGQTTWNVNATIDDRGRAWVVFDAKVNTRTSEIYVARVDKAAAVVTRVTADDGAASKYPDLAVAGDRVALTWFDQRDGNQEVYLFVARTGDLKEGLEARAMRITNTPGESIGAYVSWNARRRRFGLAWCDNTEGQHEVYFQAFDATGAAAGSPQRLTRNPTDSLIPAIQPAGDGFALAWNEYAATRRDVHETADARSEIAFALVR
ncbi:MAG: hypothetical protein ABI868_02990 [Acidobacteriota bacterium]